MTASVPVFAPATPPLTGLSNVRDVADGKRIGDVRAVSTADRRQVDVTAARGRRRPRRPVRWPRRSRPAATAGWPAPFRHARRSPLATPSPAHPQPPPPRRHRRVCRKPVRRSPRPTSLRAIGNPMLPRPTNPMSIAALLLVQVGEHLARQRGSCRSPRACPHRSRPAGRSPGSRRASPRCSVHPAGGCEARAGD